MSYLVSKNLTKTGEEWVDRIPSTWALKRFKYCSPLVVEKAVGNGELPYVGLENVESWTGRYKEATEEKPDAAANRFACGDVLFGKLRPYLAKVLKPDFEGRCTGELLVLRPKLLDGRYLQYLLLSDNFIRNVDASTYGAKMPRAEWGFIGNLKSPIPPRPQQTAIADFLDRETERIDALIAKEERLLGLLEEKRTTLISDLVTGKVTFGERKNLGVRRHDAALDRGDMSPQTESGDMSPHSKLRPRRASDLSGVASAKTELKDSGIEWLGMIPKGWEVKKLKYCSTRIKTGGTPPPEYIVPDGELDWYTPGDFDGSLFLGRSKRRLSGNAVDDGVARFFPAKSILIVGIGATLGKVALSRDQSSANQQINFVVPARDCSPEFLTYFLSLHRETMRLLSDSATLGIMNQEKTGWLPIPTPPLDVQEQIVTYIHSQTARFDALKTKINRAIELLREKRTALISAAVTGKIQVEGVGA